MKYLLAENAIDLDSIEHSKTRLFTPGDGGETPWVKKDVENNVMYLSNHALAFYPYPSWGAQLPLSSNLNIEDIRGKSPDDCTLTLHPEAYEVIEPFLNKKTNEIDLEAFNEYQKKLMENSREEEE